MHMRGFNNEPYELTSVRQGLAIIRLALFGTMCARLSIWFMQFSDWIGKGSDWAIKRCTDRMRNP